MSPSQAPNLLAESGLPLAYPAEVELLEAPDPDGFQVAIRAAVRSLTVMQKEAIVRGSGLTWRLASDEGPYLQGHDVAPAPLAYLSTGLAADLFVHVEKSLQAAGLPVDGLSLTVDSRYTIEGSLPRGTMVGGALAPEITVTTPGVDTSIAIGAAMTGVLTSPATGLARAALENSFSLTSHGVQIPVGRVKGSEIQPPHHQARPAAFPPPLRQGGSAVKKIMDVGSDTPDVGASLAPDQRRQLHLQALAARRNDGLIEIDVAVHRPHGSTFRFLSDPDARLAPDPLTYLSGGIGFCFMTQIGRYAKILGRSLGDYHIMQDTRFSSGDPAANPPAAGRAGPVQTHVYLAPDEPDFAPHALDMSEQTCFVHAMCRTELRPKVKTLAG